ncbi:MAG: response regulator, partial [Polyangiaceae bacterium]
SFVTDGQAALELLSRAHYDVLVSDLRMPGMDGVALLERVCELHPAVVRIVLSGQADEGSGLRIARVAHQFLAKPCHAPTLRRVVEKTGNLLQVLGDPKLRAMIGGVNRLPTSVRIFQELCKLLESDDASIDSVVGLVRQDPAMATKLLQFVNSSFFGLAREITDLKLAVVRLGMKTVRSLVLAIGVFDAGAKVVLPGGLSVEAFQRRAFATASIAGGLVAEAKDADLAFMAGLICDVGELVLARTEPERLAQVWADADARGLPRSEVERETWGASHAEVGACLLGLWGLPFRVVEAVAHHHTPKQAGPEGGGLSTVVWIAACVASDLAPDPISVAASGAEDLLERARQVAAARGIS